MAVVRRYDFPVKDVRQAISVLKPSFDISNYGELYVDFTAVRTQETFNSLLLKLGVINDDYESTGDFVKILYTGHTGCGKSTELIKLHKYLNNSRRYFSVYVDVQDSLQISSFEPEDVFVLLITKLVEALENAGIKYSTAGLNRLAEDWIGGDQEIIKEIEKKNETEAGVEVEAGFSLWKFLSFKGNLKNTFSYNSKTSNAIRKKIKENQGQYIINFNEILYEIRGEILRENIGREIVFIVDGIEKLRYEKYATYLETFFRDARLIQDLQSNMICCVPIDSMYDIHTNELIDGVYERFTLPMMPIDDATRGLFSEVISKRIDCNVFFENHVLDYCVVQSGGNSRQLIRIVETALTFSLNNNFRISLEIAKKACQTLGLGLRRTLTSEHFRVLKEENYFEDADKVILDMLFSLALMEYNGNLNRRQPNPLLKPYLTNEIS